MAPLTVILCIHLKAGFRCSTLVKVEQISIIYYCNDYFHYELIC